MTDDIHHPDDMSGYPDHQRAVEACEHATDALHNGDLAHAHSLLDEARVTIERVQSDDAPTQEQRETAYNCYA